MREMVKAYFTMLMVINMKVILNITREMREGKYYYSYGDPYEGHLKNDDF